LRPVVVVVALIAAHVPSVLVIGLFVPGVAILVHAGGIVETTRRSLVSTSAVVVVTAVVAAAAVVHHIIIVVVVVVLGVSTIPISPVLLRLLQPAITIGLVCLRGRCRTLVVTFYRLSSILIALIAIVIENVDFIGLRMIAGIS